MSADELSDAAQSAYDEKDYSQAAAYWRAAIALEPTMLRWHMLGRVLLDDLSDVPQALEAFRQAFALDPEDADCAAAVGEAHTAQEEHEAAIAQYDIALGLDAKNLCASVNKAFECNALGRHADALAVLEAIHRFHARDVDVLYNLACTNALLQRADPALAWLAKSFAADESYREKARIDPDLSFLNQDLRFAALLKG